MKLIKKDNKKGFTLIELVVVIAILAVLALILIPSITGYVEKANDSKNEANVRNVYTTAVLAQSTNDNVTTEEIVSLIKEIDSSFDAVSYTVTIDPNNENEITVSLVANDKTYTKTGNAAVKTEKNIK